MATRVRLSIAREASGRVIHSLPFFLCLLPIYSNQSSTVPNIGVCSNSPSPRLLHWFPYHSICWWHSNSSGGGVQIALFHKIYSPNLFWFNWPQSELLQNPLSCQLIYLALRSLTWLTRLAMPLGLYCSLIWVSLLGLPSQVEDYVPLVSKCERRLISTSSFLSQAGKLEITNAVLTFHLCTLSIPQKHHQANRQIS